MSELHRPRLILGAVVRDRRPLPRGLVIVGLALAAWAVLFLAGVVLWALIG